MKLVTFSKKNTTVEYFGLLIDGRLYSFRSLLRHFGERASCLDCARSYLEGLPESYEKAQHFQGKVLRLKKNILSSLGLDQEKADILPPVTAPAALLDFGLSPRHLVNSAGTLFKYEIPRPVNKIVHHLVKRKIGAVDRNALRYYKGNHNEIIGHGEATGWPCYTSYLDIEPELAFITGLDSTSGKTVIAGYCILNDFSARDVQFPEMIGLGLARSKDLARGNGLGPVLVTPDETGDPLALSVSVNAGSRFFWKGTTSEYAARPEDVVKFIEEVFPLRPGTIIGMGTIPGCCGLDNDLWIRPGDRVDITFDRLGTLTQYIPEPDGPLADSRWPRRRDLERFYSKA